VIVKSSRPRLFFTTARTFFHRLLAAFLTARNSMAFHQLLHNHTAREVSPL
jgi:hypothetical protein